MEVSSRPRFRKAQTTAQANNPRCAGQGERDERPARRADDDASEERLDGRSSDEPDELLLPESAEHGALHHRMLLLVGCVPRRQREGGRFASDVGQVHVGADDPGHLLHQPVRDEPEENHPQAAGDGASQRQAPRSQGKPRRRLRRRLLAGPLDQGESRPPTRHARSFAPKSQASQHRAGRRH